MSFRNFKDVVRYVTGEWDRQNAIMTEHEEKANELGQIILDRHDDNLTKTVMDFSNEVYKLGMMSGVRFGEKEVYKIIENPDYKPKI